MSTARPLTFLAATAMAACLSTTGFAADAFSSAEASGDGVLDAAEFRTFIDLVAATGQTQAVRVKTYNKYSTAFARVDKNKDGVIAKSEVAAMK